MEEVHWAISVDMGKMTRRTPSNTEVTLQLADALITSLVTLDELTTPCLRFLFYNMGTIPMASQQSLNEHQLLTGRNAF